ncbi:DUF2628 domain-containing protein [Aurantimonas sp. A3-2-R12]|uniref:DUF2628 domain-containing protein n=1 Tax=Aurantimonas sp. A3-2-R12 TaxID=3114362 RepID=UPI002E17F1E1|nr:DUF2628 domain-containing protein [Aurantimonas sp. A3-2-R12]
MALTRFIVFEPPESDGAKDAVFVRDAFSFWALLFTFLWLFRYRLWLAGIAALALSFAITLLGEQGFDLTAAVLQFLLGLLIALEGPSLRAARYRRKGWREVAAFQAADLAEAELTYYGGGRRPVDAPAAQPALAAASWTAERHKPAPARTGGFFGTTGTR